MCKNLLKIFLTWVTLTLLSLTIVSLVPACANQSDQWKTKTAANRPATMVVTEVPLHLKQDVKPNPYTKDEAYDSLDDWEGGLFIIHWPSGKRGQGHPKVVFLNMGRAKNISQAKIVEIKSHQEIRGTVHIFKTPQTTLLEDGEVRITQLPMSYITRRSGKCRRYITTKYFRDDVGTSCVKNVCGTVHQIGDEAKLELECKEKPTKRKSEGTALD